MATITTSQITQKIKLLPKSLLEEVNDYIEFLAFNSSQKDWAANLSEEQIALVKKGKKDIEQGKVISHTQARDQIENYIKSKSI